MSRWLIHILTIVAIGWCRLSRRHHPVLRFEGEDAFMECLYCPWRSSGWGGQ